MCPTLGLLSDMAIQFMGEFSLEGLQFSPYKNYIVRRFVTFAILKLYGRKVYNFLLAKVT